MRLQYVKGDATKPQGDGKKLILHIVNDIGVMGAGIAAAIKQKYPKAYESYKAQPFLRQGDVDLVKVGNDITIGNMVAQSNVGDFNGLPPIRHEALEECLIRVRERVKPYLKKYPISIHMPRVGCGLAGSNWTLIEPIISRVFDKTDINIFVYDL